MSRSAATGPAGAARPCAAAALALLSVLPRAGATADAVDRAELERVLALPADPAYGEYLAGTCAGCHAPDADGAGAIPAVHGLPAERLARALLEYRDGTRADPAMGAIAASLGDAEIAALARRLSRAAGTAR